MAHLLLVNGQQAFPQILDCIHNAKESIVINMFIWRDDSIGNAIAQAVLEAADRGVKVSISKDTYGSICEHAEESAASFFHKKTSLFEKLKINTLKIMYNPQRVKNAKDVCSDLYNKIISHPNISVQSNTFKADHSKFYLFDDSTLILGGINIEDKENGSDMSGRVYEDFMIKLEGKQFVEKFKSVRKNGISEEDKENAFYFGVNVKNKKEKLFQMEQLYLDLINSSQKELTIVMAYFTRLKKFVDAITAACERGVKVTAVIPSQANFQDDSNKAVVKKLIKKTDGKINVYFSPHMLHTKLMYNENTASFGSCNITKKAFNQLDELNVFINRAPSESGKVYEEIIHNVMNTIDNSKKAGNSKEVKYNAFKAWLEGFLV